MRQKATLAMCLIIGGSILLLIINSCTQKDYAVQSKWIYINTTEHKISYSDTSRWFKFNLQPFDTVVYESISEGPKNISEDEFVSPLHPHIIFYGKFLCDTLIAGPGPREGEGPYGMNNYQTRKIGTNNFEFTFRFTNADVQKADTCK